jgi:uncharacterized protein
VWQESQAIMKPEISFVEIGSRDAKVTNRFFSDLFGWKFEAMGEEGNGWCQGGGLDGNQSYRIGLHGSDPDPSFLVFFRVAGLQEMVQRVNALGGTAQDLADEPGFGKFCMCADPTGLKFGLHEVEAKV